MKFTKAFGFTEMKKEDFFAARQYKPSLAGLKASPVLNIDWFRMSAPTFPAHPHAGFSAVTYLFEDSKGGFVNKDSLGYVGDINPGDMHWTMAASGIIHDESPQENGVAVSGLQIFMNLPAASQLSPAKAFRVKSEDAIEASNAVAKLRFAIKGNNANGEEVLPFEAMVGELQFNNDGRFELAVPAEFSGVLLAVEGIFSVEDDGEKHEIEQFKAIGFDNELAGSIHINASIGARIAIVAGSKMEQEVHQYGPFILSSPELLKNRIDAYNKGEFGRIN